ncbi:UvrD-helicase domain-containing protein [Wenyingzhuangia sp. IMCC45574]
MNSDSFFKVYNASAGSGKTYTLVKEYLKVALRSEFEFQKILAITFTNKAAGEMKQRVLGTLQDVSQGKENAIASDVAKELSLSLEDIQYKSKRLLENIFQNYASFHIITIDSFTHKLIRTFSLDLGLPMDFNVEMDADPLLKETIDLLVSRIGEDKDLTRVLVDYTLHQVNDDKSWDVNRSLVEVAKLLLNEENELEVSRLINTSLSDFKSLESRLRKYLSDTEKAFKEIGEQALALIDDNGIEHKSFSSGDLPKYFDKFLGSCFEKEEHPLGNRLAKNMSNGVLYAKSKSTAEKSAIDAIQGELISIFEISQKICEEHFGQYLLVKKILNTLVPLTVLSYINKEFVNYREENNFRLNAEFNRVVSKQIKNEPVPFIYERLGEKFQYFFIDEMQDTSELQWENLIPLIHNSLSQNKGGLLLVGDAKQSIYRWRGGKAAQFVDLSNKEVDNEFFVEKEVVTLGTNYRSYSNIVSFNNDFFSFISDYLKDPTYKEIYQREKTQKENSKEGGYVKVELFELDEELEKYEEYGEKIYQQINEIEKNGFDKGDICILTRKKADGVAVANYLVSKGIDVISPDSLLLKSNSSVQFLIYLLRWLDNTDDKEILIQVLSFLYEHLNVGVDSHEFFDKALNSDTLEELFSYLELDFDKDLFFAESLYSGVEYVIRSFKLVDKTDVFLQTLLDLVLEFQLKEAGSLQTFIEYWGLKKEKLKVEIAADKNAVQIMTIHKSKGLEFPVVIFPFDLNTEDITKEKLWYKTSNESLFGDFDSFRIGASSKLELYGEVGVEELVNINRETQLDNFNLLYVALTRAEEQLYILCDYKESKTKSIKNYGDFFAEYINTKEAGSCLYSVGGAQKLSRKEIENEVFSLEDFRSVDKKKNNVFVVEEVKDEDSSKEFGNVIHKALEKVYIVVDIPVANSYIEQQGFELEVENKAKRIVSNVINHQDLKMYYKEGVKAYNEYSVLSPSGEMIIIDRLVFFGNNVVILDYKTGVEKEAHVDQVSFYAKVLEGMGFVVLHKFLLYCNESTELKRVEL